MAGGNNRQTLTDEHAEARGLPPSCLPQAFLQAYILSTGPQHRPGHDRFAIRSAFSSAQKALINWAEMNAPKVIKRAPFNIPAGI